MKIETPISASSPDEPASHAEETPDFDEFPASTPEEWKKAAEGFLKGAPFEKKLVTRTSEGISLQPIYFSEALAAATNLPRPGQFGHLIAQGIAAPDTNSFNRDLLAALMVGQNCAPVPIDATTRWGRTPQPAKGSDSGADGLRISTLEDLRIALRNVDLTAAPIQIWAGSSALPMLALVGALAEERHYEAAAAASSVLADPLTEWAREGSLPLELHDAYDEMANTLHWAIARFPELRVIGIQAHQWADAGGSSVDELACALATGTEYLREMIIRGGSVAAIAPRIVFAFSLGTNVFMQIAKFRAARLLWARVIEAFGGDATAAPLVAHGRSCEFNKTSLDPHTNLLRATAEAFAGIVAGVESIQVAPFDDTVRSPDAFSRRLARNIPIILDEECGLADVADAAGGSWFVEHLTRDLAEAAWKRFQSIESAGGMAAALRIGELQREVAQECEAHLSAVASGRELLVGVNLSANPGESALPAHRTSSSSQEINDVPQTIETPSHPARISDVPSAIEAFLAGWNIEQVCRALRPRIAEVPPIETISKQRVARQFEILRAKANAFAESFGQRPAAWLATFGPPRQHRARADFSSAFLACGGIEARSGAAATTVDEAVAAAVSANTPIVVICSTDDTYPELVPGFARALKERRPAVHLLLAGAPTDHEATYVDAGVDEFIHLRVNRLKFLEDLLSQLKAKAPHQ